VGGNRPGEKPFETVFVSVDPLATALKRGVNDKISTEQDKIISFAFFAFFRGSKEFCLCFFMVERR
jgi:hypothetical protein